MALRNHVSQPAGRNKFHLNRGGKHQTPPRREVGDDRFLLFHSSEGPESGQRHAVELLTFLSHHGCKSAEELFGSRRLEIEPLRQYAEKLFVVQSDGCVWFISTKLVKFPRKAVIFLLKKHYLPLAAYSCGNPHPRTPPYGYPLMSQPCTDGKTAPARIADTVFNS